MHLYSGRVSPGQPGSLDGTLELHPTSPSSPFALGVSLGSQLFKLASATSAYPEPPPIASP